MFQPCLAEFSEKRIYPPRGSWENQGEEADLDARSPAGKAQERKERSSRLSSNSEGGGAMGAGPDQGLSKGVSRALATQTSRWFPRAARSRNNRRMNLGQGLGSPKVKTRRAKLFHQGLRMLGQRWGAELRARWTMQGAGRTAWDWL